MKTPSYRHSYMAKEMPLTDGLRLNTFPLLAGGVS